MKAEIYNREFLYSCSIEINIPAIIYTFNKNAIYLINTFLMYTNWTVLFNINTYLKLTVSMIKRKIITCVQCSFSSCRILRCQFWEFVAKRYQWWLINLEFWKSSLLPLVLTWKVFILETVSWKEVLECILLFFLLEGTNWILLYFCHCFVLWPRVCLLLSRDFIFSSVELVDRTTHTG